MSAEVQPEDEGDETASIDLAIGFFCAVLMLFVFIEFNFEDAPRLEVASTLGQTEQTVEVSPGAWSAVNQRGSFAIWQPTGLALLDLGTISGGVVAPLTQYQGDNGYQDFLAYSEPAPHAFKLTLNFVLTDIPAPWLRESIVWGSDACFTTARPLVTVFVPRDTPDLGPLLEFGQRCALRLRLEQLEDVADGTLSKAPLSLSEGAYSGERMFR